MGQCQTSLLQDPATVDASGHMQQPCHAHPCMPKESKPAHSNTKKNRRASGDTQSMALTATTVHSMEATGNTHQDDSQGSRSSSHNIQLDDWSSIDLPANLPPVPSSVVQRMRSTAGTSRRSPTHTDGNMNDSATSLITTSSRGVRRRPSHSSCSTDSMQRRAQEVQARYRRDCCSCDGHSSVMSPGCSQIALLAMKLDGGLLPKLQTCPADKLPVRVP